MWPVIVAELVAFPVTVENKERFERICDIDGCWTYSKNNVLILCEWKMWPKCVVASFPGGAWRSGERWRRRHAWNPGDRVCHTRKHSALEDRLQTTPVFCGTLIWHILYTRWLPAYLKRVNLFHRSLLHTQQRHHFHLNVPFPSPDVQLHQFCNGPQWAGAWHGGHLGPHRLSLQAWHQSHGERRHG